MARYIRLIHHHDKWISADGRFASTVFEPSSRGGGISVISEECIIASGQPVCVHLKRFYPKQTSRITAYLIFENTDLPEECDLVKVVSDTGDECHHNIISFDNDKKARRYYKRYLRYEMKICRTDGTIIDFSEDVYYKLIEEYSN